MKLFFIKMLRDKNNIFFVIILVILSVLLICSLTFKNNVENYINENINKNINFRTLSVSTKKDEEDSGKSELMNINHVEDVYSSAYSIVSVDSEFVTDKLNGKIELMYLPKSTVIHTLIGTQFEEDATNVAIIPIEFYPDSSINDLQIDKGNIIDGESLIGKEIVIEYYTKKIKDMSIINDKKITKTFTVVGVYDNKEMMNYNNQIFISQKDIDEIVKARIPQSEDENIKSIQITDYNFKVVVDSTENIDYVKNEMIKKGFQNIENSVEIDESMLKTIEISCNIIALISVGTVCFIIILYIKKKMLRESTFIGILRTSGYVQKNIRINYIIEIISTCLMAYVIGIILSFMIYIILKNTIFIFFTYIGYTIKLFSKDIMGGLIIIMGISTIISLYMINQKIKKNIIDLIESRE